MSNEMMIGKNENKFTELKGMISQNMANIEEN